MSNDKKIFIGIIILLVAFMTVVGTITFKTQTNEKNNTNNAPLKFKEEYESLNNIINESNGKKIKELSIPNNNPVDILNEEETISLLENKTGIIYMGFPKCPWCRSMLPVLLQTLDNLNINKLYYLNILEIRDTLELNENDEVEITKEGTKNYYKMLEIMDNVLEPYYLKNKNGEEIDTKEKRIYAPTIIGVKNGEIVGVHVGTVDSQTNPYEDLTKEETEELSNKFIELINKVYDTSCDEAC